MSGVLAHNGLRPAWFFPSRGFGGGSRSRSIPSLASTFESIQRVIVPTLSPFTGKIETFLKEQELVALIFKFQNDGLLVSFSSQKLLVQEACHPTQIEPCATNLTPALTDPLFVPKKGSDPDVEILRTSPASVSVVALGSIAQDGS